MDCITFSRNVVDLPSWATENFGSVWITVMFFPGFHVKVKEMHWKILRWSLHIQQWIPPWFSHVWYDFASFSGGFLNTFTFPWHAVRVRGVIQKTLTTCTELFSSRVECWWNFFHLTCGHIEGKSWTKTSSTFDQSMKNELLLNSWYTKGETETGDSQYQLAGRKGFFHCGNRDSGHEGKAKGGSQQDMHRFVWDVLQHTPVWEDQYKH